MKLGAPDLGRILIGWQIRMNFEHSMLYFFYGFDICF